MANVCKFYFYIEGISDDELIESEFRGSKSSINKRSNKYERTRGNSSKGQKQTMQCLNPMQLGPPASKSKGESLSSKMLLNNSGTKLLGTSSEILSSAAATTLTALPSVPTYSQSLLDIDCEGGYNVTDSESSHLLVPSASGISPADVSNLLSPSNNIPLITSPSLTPSSNVQEKKSTIAGGGWTMDSTQNIR